MRSRLLKVIVVLALFGALVGGGVAWATAGGDDDSSVTGPAAERAGAVASARVGDGRVTEVERDSDGGGGWEVEVKRSDGSTVEVVLDGGYGVVNVHAEDGDGDGDGNVDR
jgi:outer membrane lipoprotein SlyB